MPLADGGQGRLKGIASTPLAGLRVVGGLLTKGTSDRTPLVVTLIHPFRTLFRDSLTVLGYDAKLTHLAYPHF